jgi:antitoxin MazE
MRTHIQKWGNSLGLRLPSKFLKELNLHAGNAVNIDLDGEQIVIKKEYNLDELLDQITPDNLHSLSLEDFPQGAEEW